VVPKLASRRQSGQGISRKNLSKGAIKNMDSGEDLPNPVRKNPRSGVKGEVSSRRNDRIVELANH